MVLVLSGRHPMLCYLAAEPRWTWRCKHLPHGVKVCPFSRVVLLKQRRHHFYSSVAIPLAPALLLLLMGFYTRMVPRGPS